MTSRTFPASVVVLATGLVWGGASLPAPVAAQSGDPIPILEAAAALYTASPALCADFSQELAIPLLGESRSGRGRLCQQQPNLFMMRFTEPAGDQVVADGQYLWYYTPSSDPSQVIRAPLASATGALDFHREFLENPGEKYAARLEGQETVAGNATHRVVLVPRQPSGYREAVLWIDARSSLVRRVRIQEENGSVRTISLTNIDLEASPSADTFRFTQPPGTTVLTP